ncbi:hypothetical protein F4813DRAFT_375381 [Daldinia decipiens]|uniref:uncharacterized protein n=1 Tax=Daldinia decipiens TaxID=326647 RepID=UPI0020C40870|nr:uncharacterized protein F4813DRAFT_375381 [Daldinia decipiens]KAI1653203.1 hypothetical protein F4813DRAFT_375381 [Daldinia decipiens]
MAPLLPVLRRAFDPSAPSSDFTSQFTNPSDVFSVLLLLGGDVVARALAQLVGSRITPVAFSFGWVAYAVTAVLSAIGGNRLMPAPDYSCKVVNAQNGFVRDNDSWVIGRIVRDFETWMDSQPQAQNTDADGAVEVNRATVRNPVENSVKEIIDLSWEDMKRRARERGKLEPARPPKTGLCVPVYRARKPFKNHPGYDSPYIAGLVTCLLQLGVAAIPCGLYGNWSILLVTAAGMILAFISGAIPQWAKEKWACREDTEKTFALTRGNGSQYAIVIQGAGVGFDLEDLAASDWGTIKSWPARLVVLVLAVLWIFLLIAASGIQQNTWFLLAVGGLGILQNTYVAGASRSPEAFGMPLEFVEVIAKHKVMDALLAVEDRYPRVGRSLLPIFFAEELNEEETAKWKSYGNKNKI